MPLTDIIGLQQTSDLEKEVREVVGLRTWADLKGAQYTSEKIEILVDYITEVFGLYFKSEDKMEELAADIEILTTINDDDFELTEDIINAVIGIDRIVEEEDGVPDEIGVSVKTLLVYILELLQGPGKSNEIG